MVSRLCLTADDLQTCIEALRYQAYMQAGQSCEPNLFRKEDTEQWVLAEHLQKRLDNVLSIGSGKL